MDEKKIRVALICSFSNAKMRAKLPIDLSWGIRLVSRIMGVALPIGVDTAIWNTNAIEEFVKIKEVELHVICPVRGLAKSKVVYQEDGIYYYFFKEQNSNFIRSSIHHLFTKYISKYKKNRRIIKGFIDEIKPAVVHVIGAENPFYSLSLL